MGALRIGLLAAVCLVAVTAHAGTVALLRNAGICDETGELCLRGTLTYDGRTSIVAFKGRVVRAASPGEAAFFLVGRTEGGQRVTFELLFSIDGRYSEIVDVKRAPGPPAAESWRLLGLSYAPR